MVTFHVSDRFPARATLTSDSLHLGNYLSAVPPSHLLVVELMFRSGSASFNAPGSFGPLQRSNFQAQLFLLQF
jgi:hypothetical protein